VHGSMRSGWRAKQPGPSSFCCSKTAITSRTIARIAIVRSLPTGWPNSWVLSDV
jgi:hypothetical protein